MLPCFLSKTNHCHSSPRQNPWHRASFVEDLALYLINHNTAALALCCHHQTQFSSLGFWSLFCRFWLAILFSLLHPSLHPGTILFLSLSKKSLSLAKETVIGYNDVNQRDNKKKKKDGLFVTHEVSTFKIPHI